MEDQYVFAEDLDKKTVKYVEERRKEFMEHYGNVPEDLIKKVSYYNGTRKVIESLVHGEHIVNLSLEGTKYSVSVDGKKLYETGNIIFWVTANEDCRQVALFETPGSDFGTLKIFVDGKLETEMDDKISSVVFTDSSRYLIKTYSKEQPPDGGELNSHRVLLDGKIVFGQGMKSEEFISLQKSGSMAILTVGNWIHTDLYSGELSDPSTWKLVKNFSNPVKPLGFKDGEIAYLEKKGNGIIRIGERTVLESSVPVEDCVLVEDGFLVMLLRDAKILPAVYDFSGNEIKTFDSGIPMGLRSLDSDEHSAVVNLQSFGIPFALYRYDGGKLSLLEENRLMNLSVRDEWVKSTGADVHYFMVTPEKDPKKQALAYGYGGFNISLSPMFNPTFAALLDSGVSVALANLRGGGEYGEEWHLSGTREKKQNVFNDFIAVISKLKETGYKVVASGASNGGLLVGSTMTQKPDLLDGALIGNPVLDMLRFHVMSVGKYWVSEYGNPDVPEDAEFLVKYSPYHNVRDARYPRTLIYSRLKDDRVHPAHAIKFHMKLSKVNPEAYLRVKEGGGHIGLTPEELVTELSENCNFILSCLNS